MDVKHTVSDLISAVGPMYQAIDIRAISIPSGESWLNVMAVVRLTYEDVETANERIARLGQDLVPVQTKSLRIDSGVRPFSEWPEFVQDAQSNGILRIGAREVKLRQQPDIQRAGGYIRKGHWYVRPFDGRSWPVLTVAFDLPGISPLADGDQPFHKEVHLLDYADVYEAVNALCELAVSVQHPGSDFSVQVPIFATIEQIRVHAATKTLDVSLVRHAELSSLRFVVSVRGPTTLVNEPFREHKTISDFAAVTDDEIISARGSAAFDGFNLGDYVRVRLTHPTLGGLEWDEGPARRFVPPGERNALLEALTFFCGAEELDELLVRAYDVKNFKVSGGAAFELHVAWLLGLCGFSTALLGKYENIVAPNSKVRRASVDILASRSDRSDLLLIVACTLRVPSGQDFANLRYARDILSREVFANTEVQVIPALFTSATGCSSTDGGESGFDLVPIVDADRMAILLSLLRSGNESRFLEFLTNPGTGLERNSLQP